MSYEAMAEGFARAMEEISFELANAKDYQALFNTDEMKSIVIPLYSHVMNFLCLSMRWCKKWGSTRKLAFDFFFLHGYMNDANKVREVSFIILQRWLLVKGRTRGK